MAGDAGPTPEEGGDDPAGIAPEEERVVDWEV